MLMDSAILLIVLFVLPLCAAVLMALLPSKAVPTVIYEGIHLISTAATCLLAIYLVVGVMSSGESIHALGLWFYLDSLGSLFVILIGGIGFLTGFYSLSYIRHDIKSGAMNPGQVKQYYVFFNLFIFTMLLVVLSNYIIMMWDEI
ncbi:MAG: hypothetical protein LBL27_02175 [Coriobacteriales bacterium]|jgi:hydrogenase-4 component F|nr:hypothetical protein [Coriobacteriales bacterium]